MSRVSRNNITNRSPWRISVRARPELARQLSFSQRAEAAAYCARLTAEGFKARLEQLATAFELRIRRTAVLDSCEQNPA